MAGSPYKNEVVFTASEHAPTVSKTGPRSLTGLGNTLLKAFYTDPIMDTLLMNPGIHQDKSIACC